MQSIVNMSMFYISADVGAHIGHGTDIKFIVVQIHYAVPLPSKPTLFIVQAYYTLLLPFLDRSHLKQTHNMISGVLPLFARRIIINI